MLIFNTIANLSLIRLYKSIVIFKDEIFIYLYNAILTVHLY